VSEVTNKGFKEGLESLLAEAWREDFQEKTSLFVTNGTSSKRNVKTSGGKHFSDNLNSLLEEALRESIIEQTQSFKEEEQLEIRPRTNRPTTGLDNLIRSTVETSRIEINNGNIRRVTFVFEEEKIEKLKTIARIEKSYLKNIIDDIVSEYINSYEQKKGKL
jgi:hypothetical protein